jgi:hypothetical protein
MIAAASTSTPSRAMIADVAASILSRATTTAAVTANLPNHRAERCSARFFERRGMRIRFAWLLLFVAFIFSCQLKVSGDCEGASRLPY